MCGLYYQSFFCSSSRPIIHHENIFIIDLIKIKEKMWIDKKAADNELGQRAGEQRMLKHVRWWFLVWLIIGCVGTSKVLSSSHCWYSIRGFSNLHHDQLSTWNIFSLLLHSKNFLLRKYVCKHTRHVGDAGEKIVLTRWRLIKVIVLAPCDRLNGFQEYKGAHI